MLKFNHGILLRLGKLSIFLIGFSKILTLGTMTTFRNFYQSFTSNASKSGSNMKCFISSVCDLEFCLKQTVTFLIMLEK